MYLATIRCTFSLAAYRKDKEMKRLFKVAAISALAISVTVPVFAGQWQTGQDTNKWRYQNDDGSWAADGWQQIDGAFYYFDGEGWMLSDTTTPDGYQVGADGKWIQSEPETNAVDDFQGYPVSAPTNVHWTDSFEMSWTFGKDQNGVPYHRYGRRVYNDKTGEVLTNSFGNMNPGGTSVSMFVGPATTKKMSSGSYSFEVYAIDENRNQIGPAVRSESKEYICPDTILEAPSNPRWDGTKICFDITGNSIELANQIHVQLMYSQTEDGQFEMVHESTLGMNSVKDMTKYGMKDPGYYKFRVYLGSRDIQKALASEYSEYSEAFYYTN